MRSFLTSALVLATVTASAQQAPTTPLSQLSGVQGTLGIQAGEYKFTSFDKGRLQEIALNQAVNLQQQDREYILVKSAEIELAMNGFIANTINGPTGLPTVVRESYSKGKELDIGALMLAQQQFEVGYGQIKNKLVSLTALPSAMPKEEKINLEGSGVVNLRGGGQVDLTEIIKHYDSQLETYKATFNATKVSTTLPNKKAMVNQPLGAVLEAIASMPPYDPEQIKAWTREESLARMLPQDSQRVLDQHFRKVFKLVLQYRDDFGSNQKYRVNTTPEERTNILKELELAFWSRSLLRAQYGVKLGAIGIEFTTKNFNAEYVFSSNQIKFLANPVRSQEQINEQRRSLLIALGVMDKRDDKILDAETPFLNRILSGLTFIMIVAQLAQVNVEFLKLLYADMAEEAVISTEGYQGMRRHYQQRWYTGVTDDQKQAIRDRATDWRESDQVDPDTMRGTFKLAANELVGYTAKLEEADQLKAKIQAFSKNSAVMEKYKKGADDL